MKYHKCIMASLLPSLTLLVNAAYADTILNVTETHYDSVQRPDCVAVRMNTATFSDPPSNACTPKTSVGTYGPDRITQTVYDNANQVLAVYKGVGTSSIIQYAYYNYTPNGKMAFEIDANHNKTTFTYDTFDRLSKIQYPNTTAGNEISSSTDIEQFGYDDNNNRTWWKRRNNVYIYYNYDNLNRQILTYPGDSSIPNLYTGYDLQGHILYKRFNGTGVSTANPDVTYTYDALGRTTASKDMNGRIVANNYDEASRRLRMYYPDSVNYVYYTRDYLGRVTGTNFGGVSEYLYQQTFDSRGFPYTLTRGNSAAGGTTSYTIDAIGRMSGMAINIDGTTTVHDASWTFTRNPAGQVYSWTSTGPYDYVEAATSTVAKTYDGLNRDAAIAAVSGGYDANGNVTKDATRVMKYDVYNRLLSVAAIATPTSPYLTLTYDTEGRLSAVTTTAGTKEFLYDGNNLIGEYTHVGSSPTVHTSDTMAARYVHGEGVDQPLVWYTSSAVTAPRYLFANYQGSVIAYTNATGAFQESYHYDPYGNPVNPTGGTYWFGSRFRFTGQVALPEAYLYYYKARIYDPAAGRFLQTDPVGSKDDLDLYAYVGGDPINKADPTGLANVSVYYRDMQFGPNTYYHTYIVVSGKDSKGHDVTNVYRAGPSSDKGGDKMIGGSSHGSGSPGSNSNNGYGYGSVKASSGSVAKAFESSPSDNSKTYYGGKGDAAPATQSIINNDAPVDSYVSKMNSYVDAVNNAQDQNPYWPTDKNSNSFTAGGVEVLTGKEFVPLPKKDVPGYDKDLITK